MDIDGILFQFLLLTIANGVLKDLKRQTQQKPKLDLQVKP